MGTVCCIGLDIAKEYFQVCGVDEHGKEVFNKKVKRKNVLSFFANLPTYRVGLEACGGHITGQGKFQSSMLGTPSICFRLAM